jgi:hypothetical protein
MDRTATPWLVWPHHPDALRSPWWRSEVPSLTHALAWNVFRTFELLPPAFWLRRLNAGLGLEPPRPAPATVSVRLWTPLALPPGTAGRIDAVETDVLIETEAAVWALLVCHAADLSTPRESDPDPLAMLAAAATWHAGRRDCRLGVVATDLQRAPLARSLVERYRASLSSLRMRVPQPAADLGNLAGIGLTTWASLTAILRDVDDDGPFCAEHRVVAARCLDWCEQLAL